MKPLVQVSLHDREELVADCLGSLRERAGIDFELAICADGCDFDPSPYLEQADYVDVRLEAGGHGVAINTSLMHRKPGQDFCTVDSDLKFETSNWLGRLQAVLYSNDGYGAVTPCFLPLDLPPFHGVEPNTGVRIVNNLPVGCRLMRGEVIDRLGALRTYGKYGCEDLDYDARIQAIGYDLLYASQVVVHHPGTPSDDTWKRKCLEDCIPRFHQWEEHYRAGRDLYLEPGQPQVPLPSMVTHGSDFGSHLPVLRWAVEHTKGPILELGGGLYSTPFLHQVSADGRLVVTVERNKRWLPHLREYAGPSHWVLDSIPPGYWSVVLVDQEEHLRRPELEGLRGSFDIALIHDTEPGGESLYGWGDYLSTFQHRFEYRPGGVPWTTLVSDTRALDPKELDGARTASGY